MDQSEFDTTPTRILMFDPRESDALETLTDGVLQEHNFLQLPQTPRICEQHEVLRAELSRHTDVVTLSELLVGDSDFASEAATNPNLMFTRDSSITLPWAPDLYIPARLKLAGRTGETALAGRALERFGLHPAFHFTDDEFCEGGDVLPAMDAGQRILLVGFGVRTTKAAAIRLALELIPTYVDQIIGLSHDPDLLHLDTGFTVLPNRVMFAAAGMFHSGFVIDRERRLSRIDPIDHAERLGFKIVTCDRADAIAHERCNMLPLGRSRYVAFMMPPDLRAALEAAAGISITCLEGDEIAKAAGGVHCLTRPIYK